ncbi:MAG: nicotinate-nucleotide--dimethylbenzimidazole phosphoribosyltransferase [Tannerellaceae bacterium]|jgi:nicotinate-nucleotide--dimethylbenzimidazole phosphoribosyltransferase|nr:nicotinate-nucleotide--dimethylbenzimidazole phosphoribosyltransferase [Tannerellaceae bacterium]
MKTFHIEKPGEAIREQLLDKINNLTKPQGSLGRLEELALRIGLIQQTDRPSLLNPHHILFAADHGIVEEGVSVAPKAVTRQQTENFVQGGAAINFLCRQHGFTLKVVDAGVDADFPPSLDIIDRKVRKGTRNFLHGDALTEEELNRCLDCGAELVRDTQAEGCNVISFGEMGIGNTSASSLWTACLAGIPLAACTGAGAGLDSAGVSHKYSVLKQALDRYRGDPSPFPVMQRFGGLEMAMAVGAMLQAAELRMIILIDGFIMTACLLAAERLSPGVTEYALFGHESGEAGHRLLLDYLGAQPLLHLNLRLGEGSGALCAFPLVDSAVRMMREMHSFHRAEVAKYF